MKILIIGYGSIGQRHYNNLLKLGFNDVYIFEPDNSKLINKNLKIVKSINKNNLKQFDIVFICNPNNLHIKYSLLAAKSGCHLFIEKPLSHNMQGIRELENICKNNKLITMIACNMRFHPCVEYIKKNINKVGKIYRIENEFGYYLPYWRPQQDYKKNYASKKQTGGGIILDDIHEFDLLFWLNNFKKILNSRFIYGKISDLKIQTEDICLATFKFENDVLGLVKCDYLNKEYTRNCKIIGSNGNLEWNWNENIVWFKSDKVKKKILQIKNYDSNQMYIEEIKYFLNQIRKKQKTFNDIEIASKVLKYCYERK